MNIEVIMKNGNRIIIDSERETFDDFVNRLVTTGFIHGENIYINADAVSHIQLVEE